MNEPENAYKTVDVIESKDELSDASFYQDREAPSIRIRSKSKGKVRPGPKPKSIDPSKGE